MKENREFKGVFIPKEIRLAKNLSPIEKFFFIEIDSLGKSNRCFASNKHFSGLFGLTKGRCTQIIKALEEKGLIKVTIKRKGKMIVEREIEVVNKLNTLPAKIKQPYLENTQDNIYNKNINNKKEINKEKVIKEEQEFRKEFEDFFKDKLNKMVYPLDLRENFLNYRLEPFVRGPNKGRCKFTKEKTWSLQGRLDTFLRYRLQKENITVKQRKDKQKNLLASME